MTTPAASRKDKYGHRYYSIPHPVTRELLELPSWSRLKNQLYNGGLETWKLKKVAAAVAMSTALQMEAANPETVYQAVNKAMESDTEAADVGTYVHRYTEQIDSGTLEWEFVPPAAAPFVKEYEKLKAEWCWETVEQEVTIYNLLFGYSGTPDRFARFTGLPALLGLPEPERDVFPLDIKTGKVWPEVALQLACYSNGDGIFEAPSKIELGFALREAQLEDDIRAGIGFDRINPNRRKWSEDAIKEARAQLDNEWWQAYAEHGRHRPMPDGLRRDVGLVILLHADGAKLLPVRLDGDPATGEVPAVHVLDGLVALYKWGRRKVIGEPIERGSAPVEVVEVSPAEVQAEAVAEMVANPVELCSWPHCVEHVVGVPCYCGPHWNRLPEDFRARLWETLSPDAEIEAWISDPDVRATKALEAGGMLEGAEVGNADEMAATDEDKTPYLEWLSDIAGTRKHLLPALRSALDNEGLTKKLRTDTWTMGELRRWSQCAIAVERAGR